MRKQKLAAKYKSYAPMVQASITEMMNDGRSRDPIRIAAGRARHHALMTSILLKLR